MALKYEKICCIDMMIDSFQIAAEVANCDPNILTYMSCMFGNGE